MELGHLRELRHLMPAELRAFPRPRFESRPDNGGQSRWRISSDLALPWTHEVVDLVEHPAQADSMFRYVRPRN